MSGAFEVHTGGCVGQAGYLLTGPTTRPGAPGPMGPPGTPGSGLAWIDARDYVVGDGLADDTFALQDALDAAVAVTNGHQSCVVYLPGLCKVSGPIVVPPRVVLRGDGINASGIIASPTFPTNTPVLRLNDTSGSDGQFTRVENLHIDCSGIPGSTGVWSTNVQEAGGIERVLIIGFGKYAVHLQGAGCQHCAIRELWAYPNNAFDLDAVVYLDGCGGNIYIRDCTVGGSTGTTKAGILVNGGWALISGLHVESVTYGVEFGQYGSGKVDFLLATLGSKGVLLPWNGGGGYHLSSIYAVDVAVQDDFTGRGPNGYPYCQEYIVGDHGAGGGNWPVITTASVATRFGGDLRTDGHFTVEDTGDPTLPGFLRRGTGSPEGVVLATLGSLYLEQNGSLFVKEGGGVWSNTGWRGHSSTAYNVRSFGAKGDGTTDDTVAIQAAIDAAWNAGGGTVIIPAGRYLVSPRTHFQDPAYAPALILRPNVHVMVDAAGIILLAVVTGFATANVYLALNHDIAGGSDRNIRVTGGVWDGQAAGQTRNTYGIILMRVKQCVVTDVTVQNCRGSANSGAGETFHFDAQLSSEVIFDRCTARRTAGPTASGFSANGSQKITWRGCLATDMTIGLGFTHNGCEDLMVIDCQGLRNASNFNSETTVQVVHQSCVSLDSPGYGFIANGSTRAQFVNCIARRNQGQGLNFSGGATGSVINGLYQDQPTIGIGLEDGAKVRLVGKPIVSPNVVAVPGGYISIYGEHRGYIHPASGVPAVPAAYTMIKNPFPYDVLIYLQGGDTTDVMIGGDGWGQGIPLQTSWYKAIQLPWSVTIGLAYSVAPTGWAWFATG